MTMSVTKFLELRSKKKQPSLADACQDCIESADSNDQTPYIQPNHD